MQHNRRHTGVWRAVGVAAAALSMSLVVGAPPQASAATLTVDVIGDDPNAGLTLREAVGAAQPGDTIRFAGSLIGDTITLNSALAIGQNLTIVGLGISALTLESTIGPTLFVDDGAALTISDLRIEGVGNAIETSGSGDVEVDRVVVKGGSTGIEFDSPGSDLRLNGTFVDENPQHGISLERADEVVLINSSARDNGSAGLQTQAPTSIGSLRLQNSDLSRNGAAGVHANFVTGHVVVVDSFLEDNVGRGLDIERVGGDVTMSRTSVLRNINGGVRLGPVVGDVSIDELDVSDNRSLVGLDVDASESDSVSITGSTVSRNTGFGLIVKAVSGRLVVEDTEGDDNGSAGMNVDGAKQSAVIEVTKSAFRRNGGSGVSLEGVGGDVSISDTVSANNSNGVAIFSGGSGRIELERVHADGNARGLSLADLSGSTSLSDSTISKSTEFGIAVDDSPGPVTVERLTFTGNATALAGFGPASSVRVVNSTFTGNAAPDAMIQSTSASLDIRHSTLTGNAPTSGAPLIRAEDGGSVVLDHSIATGNGSGPLSSVDPDSTVSVTNSLVPVGSSLGATNVEVADPKLGPLADNGGDTETMLPMLDSPAVDAGDLQIANPPATDQRGEVRVSGPAIDIGAVEIPGEAAITSLAPSRFVDTRSNGDTFDDRFQAEGRRTADSEYRVTIAGRGGVPADARAVVINVTAVGSASNGFVTVHPCVDPRPVASSLNYTPGVNMANEIVAPLTAAGELCLYTNRSIHLLVDVVGFVDARSPLVPLTPSRYLDTRPVGDTFDDRNEGAGIPGAQSTTTLPVAGRGGVPADAAAVIVNVTAVGAGQRGFVTVHPCLAEPPLASSLNHVAGINRANELIASVDSAGNICLFTSRAIHLVVDVVGYLPAGSTFSAIPPARFLDTRSTGETVDGIAEREGTVAAGDEYELQITGRPGVPDTATAVVVNVTAAGPDSRGFVTVHPCVDPPPNASSLNYVAGVNGANELIMKLDADGKLCLFTNEPVDLIVDVVGYLS
jgi:hypothetical protein